MDEELKNSIKASVASPDAQEQISKSVPPHLLAGVKAAVDSYWSTEDKTGITLMRFYDENEELRLGKFRSKITFPADAESDETEGAELENPGGGAQDNAPADTESGEAENAEDDAQDDGQADVQEANLNGSEQDASKVEPIISEDDRAKFSEYFYEADDEYIKDAVISSVAAFFGLLFVKQGDDIYYFFTLERCWFGNKNNISCIPEDNYLLAIRKAEESKKFPYEHFKLYPDISGPKDNDISSYPSDIISKDYVRSNILIHRGNWPREIQGCILISNSIDIDKYNGREVLYGDDEDEALSLGKDIINICLSASKGIIPEKDKVREQFSYLLPPSKEALESLVEVFQKSLPEKQKWMSLKITKIDQESKSLFAATEPDVALDLGDAINA